MGTVPRVDVPEHIFHVHNRANAAGTLFQNDKDYLAFLNILIEALEDYPLKIYAYCVMPNHWHFVCSPLEQGGMATFFRWVTGTHAKRWHASHETTGSGHLYQDRFKSHVCSPEPEHFLRLVRYVERNALRAKLVAHAEGWKWGSAWCRAEGTTQMRRMLTGWPVDMPSNYSEHLNQPQGAQELDSIRKALKRGSPFGPDAWRDKLVEEYGLEATVRSVGRPKKRPQG